MARSDIACKRLINQHISQARFKDPEKVVEWLGAIQAQDYAAAKWSLGLRLQGARDADVERAFSVGAILRTHLLRPTWHFVAPGDIRWLLALTAARVQQANAYMYRKLGLDSAVFKRSNAALARALRGGKQLTRDELREVLHDAGIATEGEFRMGYLMMRAETRWSCLQRRQERKTIHLRALGRTRPNIQDAGTRRGLGGACLALLP